MHNTTHVWLNGGVWSLFGKLFFESKHSLYLQWLLIKSATKPSMETLEAMTLDKVDNMREGEFITSDLLRDEWTNTLATYDLFINGGHKLRPVRFIVRHIIEKGYDTVLFPGTSMYSLLISIPVDSKVDFNKTLKIEFDHLTEKLKFKYIDRTKGQIRWEETCQATEGSELLESFLTDNEDFRQVTKGETKV